jgi:tetratricopeptide (TPR) repeat protein
MKNLATFAAAAVTLWTLVAPAAADTEFPSEEAMRRYAIGRLYEEDGDYGAALREYYRAFVLDPGAPALARRMSELSARIGDSERSLEFAERGLATSPQDPELMWLRGAALFNLGRQAEAYEVLEQAAARDTLNAEFQRTFARAAEQVGRVDRAADAYRRATSLDPEDAESWFQLAAAEARLGRFDAAEIALGNARDLGSVRPGIKFLDGWVHEGQGRNQQAIASYREHLEGFDSDQITRRRLVQLLARERRFEEAYQEAGIVSRGSPGDFLALEVEADLAFRAKHANQGEQIVLEMLAQSGSDPDRAFRATAMLVRNDRKKRGISLADTWATSAQPPNGEMLSSRIRGFAEDPRGAMTYAQRAVAIAPDSLAPRVLVARLHANARSFAAAESAWTETLPRGADTVAVLLEVAFCREQLKDIAGAESAVRDALQRDPNNPRVLNFLGYLLADDNRNLQEALILIRRALENDPENGAYVDSLGWAYYRLGRLDEARAELERAIRLTDGDPVVHEHLGDVYRDLKMFSEAREQYKISLARDGANPNVREKLSRLR